MDFDLVCHEDGVWVGRIEFLIIFLNTFTMKLRQRVINIGLLLIILVGQMFIWPTVVGCQVFFQPLFAAAVKAEKTSPPVGTTVNSELSKFGQAGGLGDKAPANANNPEIIAGQVIQAVLSFLGVIFLLLTVYGGYLWMIARGNEEEVTKAKDIIIDATLGLVVILSAYAATMYVLDSIISKILVK